jgi:hypothetical protein
MERDYFKHETNFYPKELEDLSYLIATYDLSPEELFNTFKNNKTIHYPISPYSETLSDIYLTALNKNVSILYTQMLTFNSIEDDPEGTLIDLMKNGIKVALRNENDYDRNNIPALSFKYSVPNSLKHLKWLVEDSIGFPFQSVFISTNGNYTLGNILQLSLLLNLIDITDAQPMSDEISTEEELDEKQEAKIRNNTEAIYQQMKQSVY